MQLKSQTYVIKYCLLLEGVVIAEDEGDGAWGRMWRKWKSGMRMLSVLTTVTIETADITEHAVGVKQLQKADEAECRAKVAERRLEWDE